MVPMEKLSAAHSAITISRGVVSMPAPLSTTYHSGNCRGVQRRPIRPSDQAVQGRAQRMGDVVRIDRFRIRLSRKADMDLARGQRGAEIQLRQTGGRGGTLVGDVD